MKAIVAILACLAQPLFADECYDLGSDLKSRNELLASGKRRYGFTESCKSRMNLQKKSLADLLSAQKNGLGLAIDDELSTNDRAELNVWQRLEQLKSQNENGVKFPKVSWWRPLNEVHMRGQYKYGSRRTWRFNAGTPKSFEAEVRPYVGFFGSRIEAAGEAGVELHASLLGNWQGKLAAARALAFSPGTGPLSIDLQIFGPEGDMMWSQNVFKTLQIRFDKDIDLKVAHETTWRFALGPVPMAAEVGALGTVGMKNSVALYPLQVSAWGKPWVAAEAYVMTGVDMWVFGTGTGGQLKLASDELTFKGRSLIEYNEEPTVTLHSSVDNELTLLSGDIFAFLYLKIPAISNLWQEKFTIFNWDGIKVKRNLVQSALVAKRGHTLAFGDVNLADLELQKMVTDADSIINATAKYWDQSAQIKSQLVRRNQRIKGTAR